MRIFVSYSSRDRLEALRLKEIAEGDGHQVWLDVFDIQPSAQLAEQLNSGIRSVDMICVLLSPTAVDSAWVNQEIETARALETQGVQVLPIILRAAPLPEGLRDLVAIDATLGLSDDAVALRVRRALGTQVRDGVLLDALRGAELADQAVRDAAEQALPDVRRRLERVADLPITELSLTIDQDTWPGPQGALLELLFTIDHLFLGSAVIVAAPYDGEATWRGYPGLEPSPREEFFASTKPRADARFSWAGRVVLPNRVIDGTDLGEQPLRFSFTLGGEYSAAERRATMAQLERFEIPSLRKLIDRHAKVRLRVFPLNGDPYDVDPLRTDLVATLTVPLRHSDHGVYGFTLWRTHQDHESQVLLASPSLRDCATDIEREALLSLYRDVPLRAAQTSRERVQRLAALLAQEAPIPDEDRWAAFTLLVGQARLLAMRGQRFEAGQQIYQALRLTGDAYDVTGADYVEFFRVWSALMFMADLLNPEHAGFYLNAASQLASQMSQLHPGEPDYASALALSRA
ncbi:hypothetical protein F4553_000911 [Allocatelliglobosispora scoriae]|uniref:TIR domain-containing protein n=1 Tax=Allocatelliglobosispora scoriae TaxID=643052 RepID=A0A841BLA9_9ACTN|nr:toll/interleukin-1 receptor domain-containing protein [Allocatelliglobosispora scoriae]MBB5867532.1 hypothetical protein [Allocatelliglobosispora scoriae]